MPLYYFNVYDGVSSLDTEGTNLLDGQSIRDEAVKFVGQILNFEPKTFYPCQDWRMEVTDRAGLILLRLDVLVTESPAMIQDGAAVKNASAKMD